jgi:hypothetical protein
MGFMKVIALAGVLCAAPAIAQTSNSIQQLSWMTGTWVQTKENDTVQESWLGPQGNTMVAVNLTQSARRGMSFEFLRIVETPGGLSYMASPNGRSPATEFKLKEMGDKRVVFENPTHDFPQRVIYWREADGSMKARIEGTIQGKERSMEWRFERAKAEAK